ncbi:MAG: hypothetical protein ACRDRI_10755 [Pseudonocardiaceae bacterium]
MTVLILARDINPSADLVVAALGERGVPVFRPIVVRRVRFRDHPGPEVDHA